MNKSNNNLENAKNWREKLTSLPENSPLKSLVDWPITKGDFNYLLTLPCTVPNKDVTPLEIMCYAVKAGLYPTPDILLAIADAFEDYLANEGRISLEKAFFSTDGTRNSGNFAQQAAKHKDGTEVDYEIHRIKEKNSCTLIKAAEITKKEKGKHAEEASMLRARLRRHKSKRNVMYSGLDGSVQELDEDIDFALRDSITPDK